MKKERLLHSILALALAVCPIFLIAQLPNVQAMPVEKEQLNLRRAEEASLQGGARAIIWSNDFSNCNEWVIDNAYDNGLTDYAPDLNFECGVGLTPSGFAPIAPIESTTSDNGFMLVDSDLHGGENGGVDIENCWFQTVQPINCSAHPFVSISFETFYYMWDGGSSDGNEYCLLEVSRDGVTWPNLNTFEVAQGFVDFGDGDGPVQARWELWPEMQTQDPVNNPTVKTFEISSAAGGQETIWIRFRWKGTWGYSWMVDDVELFDTPQNDVALVGYQSYTDYENTGMFEASIWPSSQTTQVQMAANVANQGVQAQNGVNLNAYVNGALVGSSAPSVLDSQENQLFQISGYTLPATPGTYSLELLAEPVNDDEDPENNSSTTTFEVSEYIFARDNGVFTGAFPGATYNDEFIAAVPYQFFGDGNIHAVQVALTAGSVEAPMICHILELDGEFDIIASSSELALNTSFLNEEFDSNDIQWYTFVFDDPWPVSNGDLLCAGFQSYGGSGVRLGTAQEVPDQTSFVFGDFGGSGFDWYFTYDVSMIRFSLDPNAQNTGNPTSGCPDPLACNYQPNPDILEVCTYPGCTLPSACNYDPTAGCNDGSCLVFDACGDCGGTGVAGCTDAGACNFNPNATCSDFSCTYPGCVDFTACNYDPGAGCSDDSCIYTPEIDIQGPVVVGAFTSAEFSIEDLADADFQWEVTGGAITSANDQASVTIFWGDEGIGQVCVSVGLQSCPTVEGCINVVIAPDNEMLGCTNSSACNFNPNATTDNGSCFFVGDPCNDGDPNTINDTVQSDCECAGEIIEDDVLGCTDSAACNYNPQATQDDGSCVLVGDACDDGNPETINDVITTGCECAGEIIEDDVLGCTDSVACNYNPQATQDDGSCEYVQLYAIEGPVGPEAFSTVPYSYPSTAGSTYAWTVSNGVIAGGQSTSQVEVIWSNQGSGSISVTETDNADCLGATVTLDVVVLPTNIDELTLQNINIYPNPAQTSFRMDLPENFTGGHIELFSLTGQLVGSTQLVARSQQVDVSHLVNGIYLVHVNLPTGRSVVRLSVAR